MNDLARFELKVEAETDMAVLVTNINYDKVWLPKSQIEIDGDYILIPQWLVDEKEIG